MLANPLFWTATSLVIFFGILLYAGVPAKIAAALDGYSLKVGHELAEAKKLRQDALALMEEYKIKAAQAEKDAAEIVANAKTEAERLSQEAKAKLEDFVARRTQMAETKIQQAEAQAIADVKAAASELAVSAAERVFAQKVESEKMGRWVVASALSEVKKKLN